MSKLLIVSTYPAPYRLSLFERFRAEHDVDVFFETGTGDARNEAWFQKGTYQRLDEPEGAHAYKNLNLKSYDLVLAFEYSSVTAIRLIAKCKRKRIPYIINCDGVMLTKHGNFLRDMIKRYLIKDAALCFASGENAKKYFLRYGAKEEKIVIHTFSTLVQEDILPSVPTQTEKKALRAKLGLPLDASIAVAVGRFIPLKRYDALIRAWEQMPHSSVLTVIGGGEEEAHYKRIIAERGLKNVILLPFFPKQELLQYYTASDVFLHPTGYDVWGLVVNEAMACGLPCVVSDRCVAGLELIENGENGYIIPVGDDGALCERAREILSSPAQRERMGKNALAAIAPYTIENMADTHLNAMKRILSDG